MDHIDKRLVQHASAALNPLHRADKRLAALAVGAGRPEYSPRLMAINRRANDTWRQFEDEIKQREKIRRGLQHVRHGISSMSGNQDFSKRPTVSMEALVNYADSVVSHLQASPVPFSPPLTTPRVPTQTQQQLKNMVQETNNTAPDVDSIASIAVAAAEAVLARSPHAAVYNEERDNDVYSVVATAAATAAASALFQYNVRISESPRNLGVINDVSNPSVSGTSFHSSFDKKKSHMSWTKLNKSPSNSTPRLDALRAERSKLSSGGRNGSQPTKSLTERNALSVSVEGGDAKSSGEHPHVSIQSNNTVAQINLRAQEARASASRAISSARKARKLSSSGGVAKTEVGEDKSFRSYFSSRPALSPGIGNYSEPKKSNSSFFNSTGIVAYNRYIPNHIEENKTVKILRSPRPISNGDKGKNIPLLVGVTSSPLKTLASPSPRRGVLVRALANVADKDVSNGSPPVLRVGSDREHENERALDGTPARKFSAHLNPRVKMLAMGSPQVNSASPSSRSPMVPNTRMLGPRSPAVGSGLNGDDIGGISFEAREKEEDAYHPDDLAVLQMIEKADGRTPIPTKGSWNKRRHVKSTDKKQRQWEARYTVAE